MEISLKNSSGQDLALIYPNEYEIEFVDGQTTTGSATEPILSRTEAT